MGEIRQAIIKDNAILCPYCRKINGRLTGKEEIKNFKMRCRGSNGKLEHFFMLNTETEEKQND